MKSYSKFLSMKQARLKPIGFEPVWMSDALFDFQANLVEWAIRKGCGGLFEDCGLGKTIQQLVWAENIVRKTNGSVLVATPLAVSAQTKREGEKFGIEVHHTREGKIKKGINVTNYERLHYFKPEDFVGVVADESGILKNFDGKMRRRITDFLHQVRYRLLCTATPAPNDYMELGSSSEALGVMKHVQMLGMFFTNAGDDTQQWTLKGHARTRFWRWMSQWARAVRFPSDLGFEDGKFILPQLVMKQYEVASKTRPGMLLPIEARTLNEQRAERRETLEKRCQLVADILPEDGPCVVWCHLNKEGDTLEKMLGAVQVKGSDRDVVKEERLQAFSQGQIRVLVTKPTIAGFGLNWQHCSWVSFFPSHSFEQFYQAVRRCWRFGQKKDVLCNIVTSQSESRVLNNLKRKERQAADMYAGLVREMKPFQVNGKPQESLIDMEVPGWLV